MSYDYFYGQSGELFSYFRIPKALFQDHRFRQLSTDARTLYGILLDRMSLSAKNGWLDEQGRVYIIYTVREVQESLCCAEHKAVKLFRELEDMDLIERKRRGLGRPSLIYVKDFSSGLPKAQVQNCPNSNSGAAESAILEQPKPQANKTDKNKTEWNDPDPIYSGGIREQLEDYFYQALEVELLLRLCPDDEDTIYQIVDLLVDTCSTKRKMLRIAGDDKPAEVVRSRLKKLNADHMSMIFPMCISLIAGYMISREQTDDTLKNILTVPISFKKLLTGKLIVCGVLSIIFGLICSLFTIIAEMIVGFPGFEISLALKAALQITAVNFFLYLAVLPIIALTCRRAGSFLVGVIIAFVYGYGGMFAAGNMTLANLYPITASLGMVGYRSYDTAVNWNIGTCSCSLALAVVISAILILCMKEREATQTKKKAKKVAPKKGW